MDKKIKVEVKRTFYDVETKKKNRPGDVLEITEDRLKDIQKNTDKLIKAGKLEKGAVLVEVATPETVPAPTKKTTKKSK